jgi:hypothetical protein
MATTPFPPTPETTISTVERAMTSLLRVPATTGSRARKATIDCTGKVASIRSVVVQTTITSQAVLTPI